MLNEPPEITNPFPGLRPFATAEYRLFFGREGQSDELIKRLGRSHFLAVVGTSGSGKSSLVRAGLLPALRGGMMAGAGARWRVAVIRPGGDPVGNLARELAKENVLAEAGGGLPPPAAKALIEATLRGGSLGLVEAVKQARLADGEKLLVIADQFEEIFRFRAARAPSSTDDAAAFVKLLLEAVRQREQNVYVVLTMRSDFLGDCSQFQGLPEAINDGQYLIPRMNRDERRAAIVGPVRVARGRMSEPLINRLLNDVGDNPDQLPILQHALMRTWKNWAADLAEREPVDLRHYEAVGTMSGALSEHADEAYNELPDERSRHVAQLLFKALTERGADNREIRRPTRLSEACEITGASADEVAAVVEVFRKEGRSFLMPPAGSALRPGTVLDISHESLIRNWEQLKKWVEEEAQSARIYKRLAEAAVLNRAGEEGLLQEPGLSFALDWREKSKPNAAWGRRYHPEFDTAIAYLDESREAHEAALAEIERRKQEEAAEIERRRQEIEQRKQEEADRERHEMEQQRAFAEEQERSARREMEQARAFAEQQKRSARRLRWAAAAMAVLLVLSLGTAAYAYGLKLFAQDNYEKAVKATDEAVKARARAEDEKLRAEGLAKDLEKNYKELETAQAESATQAKRADKQAGLAVKRAAEAEQATKEARRERDNAKKTLSDLEMAKATTEATKTVADLTKTGLEAAENNELGKALKSYSDLVDALSEIQKNGLGGSMKLSTVDSIPVQYGWALSKRAAVQLRLRKLADARTSYEKARETLEGLMQKDDWYGSALPTLFKTYHGLGRTYQDIALEGAEGGTKIDSGEYFLKSEKFFKDALGIQKRLLEQAPNAAEEVAAGQLELARLYRDMGKLKEAADGFTELVKFQTEHGSALKVIEARKKLAEFYRGQGDMGKAENIYKELIDEQEKAVVKVDGDGEDDYAKSGSVIADSYDELAETYRSQESKETKAKDAFAVAAAIRRFSQNQRLQSAASSSPAAKAMAMAKLADDADAAGQAYAKIGKPDRALALYEYALGVRKEGGEKFRDGLAKSYENLTRLYREKGFADNSKAEESNLLLIQQLSSAEPGSPRLAEALSLCADIYAKQGRTPDAKAYYENALGIYAKQNDWMNQNVVLYSIGSMYAKKNMVPDWKAAALRRLELLTTQLNKIVGTKDALPRGSITLVSEYVASVAEVAFIQSRDRNDAEAAATFQKALDAYDFITQRIYNMRTLKSYAETLDKYERLLNKMGRGADAAKVASSAKLVRDRVAQSEKIEEQQKQQVAPQQQVTPPSSSGQ